MRALPFAPSVALARARAMRRTPTPAEAVLWRELRARSGLKVRRQVPLGPYILDFVILAGRLVIEVDGESHATGSGPARDERRDAWLGVRGWRVLRFTNAEVMGNIDGVLSTVSSVLAAGPHPGPLPMGEGDGAEALSHRERVG